MIRWTGLAPWEFELSVPGSLTCTFLSQGGGAGSAWRPQAAAGAGRGTSWESAEQYSSPYSYLTECIYQLVLGSQLPRKIVTLFLTVSDSDIRLTVLWGS